MLKQGTEIVLEIIVNSPADWPMRLDSIE